MDIKAQDFVWTFCLFLRIKYLDKSKKCYFKHCGFYMVYFTWFLYGLFYMVYMVSIWNCTMTSFFNLK